MLKCPGGIPRPHKIVWNHWWPQIQQTAFSCVYLSVDIEGISTTIINTKYNSVCVWYVYSIRLRKSGTFHLMRGSHMHGHRRSLFLQCFYSECVRCPNVVLSLWRQSLSKAAREGNKESHRARSSSFIFKVFMSHRVDMCSFLRCQLVGCFWGGKNLLNCSCGIAGQRGPCSLLVLFAHPFGK